MGKTPLSGALLFACVLLAAPRPAQAHREDYSDETLVYLTLGLGEWEPEYWFDYGRHRDREVSFLRHSLALEYGITERWMLDGRASFGKDVGAASRFESGRFETRYRFSEEGRWPVDIAVSAEVNTSREADGSRESAIEPRLILSKDRGPLNVTLNLSEEIPLEAGKAHLIGALGLRHVASGHLRAGFEVKYDKTARAGALVPQVWLALSRAVTVKLAVSIGFERNRDSFGRMAIEIEL